MIYKHIKLGPIVPIDGCLKCPWLRGDIKTISSVLKLDCLAYEVSLKVWPTPGQPKPSFCKVLGIPVQVSED